MYQLLRFLLFKLCFNFGIGHQWTLSIFLLKWFDLLDIDECDHATHHCHANATCANTNGSYTCTCQTALNFVGNGTVCRGWFFKTWVTESHLLVLIFTIDWQIFPALIWLWEISTLYIIDESFQLVCIDALLLLSQTKFQSCPPSVYISYVIGRSFLGCNRRSRKWGLFSMPCNLRFNWAVSFLFVENSCCFFNNLIHVCWLFQDLVKISRRKRTESSLPRIQLLGQQLSLTVTLATK